MSLRVLLICIQVQPLFLRVIFKMQSFGLMNHVPFLNKTYHCEDLQPII